MPFGLTVLLNTCFTCYFICTACGCLRSQINDDDDDDDDDDIATDGCLD